MRNSFYLVAALMALLLSACNNPTQQAAVDSNMPEQEKQLREQIAQHPDSMVLKENLIEYFRTNNNYSAAIAETDKLIQKDTANERLWYIKATLHSENDDTTQAIAAWEKTIKFAPRPEYLMSLGTLYAFTKNPLALGMGDILIAYGPSAQYQGFFIKGLYNNNIGNKEEAIKLFNQCIAIDYTNVLAFREKAIAEYDMGNYTAAVETLEVALKIKKTYDEAYYWLGRCFEKMGKRDEAIESYKMALQMANGDYIEAKDALGKLGIVP